TLRSVSVRSGQCRSSADVSRDVARHSSENDRPSSNRLPAGDIRSATITVTSLCLDGSLRTAHTSEHIRVCTALQLRNHPRAFDDPDDDGTLHPRTPRHRRVTYVNAPERNQLITSPL